jgi:DNA-directed RNA polymerase specialized sigma24 family protein
MPETGTAPLTLASVPLDAQTTRELGQAAEKVRTWTAKRNALIRAAFAAGGGIREIAKATGLNVGTVHTMLHGRKR